MTLSRFGDLVHLNTDRIPDPLAAGVERYVGLEHIEPENLHIRSWGNVADGITFTNHFKPGQVLFGKRRAYQRKVAVADFEGVCSSDIYVFESKDPNVLLPELMPFICQSEGFYQYAVTTSAGSLSPRTNWTHLANYEFPLPPLDEQRRIADLLWAADDVIAENQILISSLGRLWVSAAAHLFQEISNQNEFRLGDLLVYASDGPFGSNLKSIHYAEQGARVIRQQNIGILDFKDEDKSFVSMSHYEKILVRYTVKPGDILVGGIGDPQNPPGRACLVPENIGLAIIKAHSYCLRAKDGVSNSFLVNFLNSPQGLQQTMTQAQGSAQTHLTLKKIKSLKIPSPPLEIQEMIATKLNRIHKTQKKAFAHLASTFDLKQNMLQDMIG